MFCIVVTASTGKSFIFGSECCFVLIEADMNIGFISTRFSGTDGVSLESSKWAEVLGCAGHRCYWFAGKLDQHPETSFLVPEAHFKFENNQWINHQVYGAKHRSSAVTQKIHDLRSLLKKNIGYFISHFHIDLLIIENALSIPLHIPLGMAITEIISETGIPTIAHHHDFHWERTRFLKNAVREYIQMAFPPDLNSIRHAVINTNAQKELAHRRGIVSTVVPNVLNFEKSPPIDQHKVEEARCSLGFTPDDILILQPTRIIRRKGIEMTIDLVKALDDPRCKIIISHEGGDEGFEYFFWLINYAQNCGVDLRLVGSSVESPWAQNGQKGKMFSLWDIYPLADVVSFPSRTEGFGNALLEAIYFKKPILINRYPNFINDIEPNGFDLIGIDGFVDHNAVQSIKEVLRSEVRRHEMTFRNFQIASKQYSYAVLEKKLLHLRNSLITKETHDQANQPTGADKPSLAVNFAV